MRRPRITLIRNYRPPVSYRHFARFANGVTLRFGSFGMHIWFA